MLSVAVLPEDLPGLPGQPRAGVGVSQLLPPGVHFLSSHLPQVALPPVALRGALLHPAD